MHLCQPPLLPFNRNGLRMGYITKLKCPPIVLRWAFYFIGYKVEKARRWVLAFSDMQMEVCLKNL